MTHRRAVVLVVGVLALAGCGDDGGSGGAASTDQGATEGAKKAPALDVDRCLLITTPTKFLSILWAELTVASSMGQLDVCRRIATSSPPTARRAITSG